MHKPALSIIATLSLCTCVYVENGDEQPMETFTPGESKKGWSDEITPSVALFFPGPEKKMLKIVGDDLKTSQWYTVYIAVKPLRDEVGLYFPVGPIIGRLHMGTDGGDADVEFDCDGGRSLGQDPLMINGNSVNLTGGTEYNRSGLTVISFQASTFELFLRNDERNRTILPMTAVPGDGNILQRPIVGGTSRVAAWAAYGARKTPLYRRIILSNGPESAMGVGAASQALIPVPTAAKRFRVFRTAFTAGPVIAPNPAQAVQVQAFTTTPGNFPSHVYNIPVNDVEFREMPINTLSLVIVNNGPDSLFAASVEFELEL